MMLSILINAYACAPHLGSEPGMGWNWIVNLSAHCQLYIITEGEWQDQIEEAISILPQKDRIHFFYLPVSDRVREICWNQGDWRFYYYYHQWQRKALLLAKQIISEYPIDIIHQLNMIGFREPGCLWEIKGLPFVWGPIGGMNLFPANYLEGVDSRYRFRVRLKNLLNKIQMRFHPRVRKAIVRADALLAATPESGKVILNIYERDAYLISETGCATVIATEATPDRYATNGRLDLLWVGRFFYAKQLNIALETVACLKDLDIRLHIVGDGSDEDIHFYKELAMRLAVDGQCVWYGKVDRERVFELMRKVHLFFFTSVSEATSTVVLEALQHRLPVVCFDTCGFGAVVSERTGRKIALSNPARSAFDFASLIRSLYDDRALLQELSDNCEQESQDFSWPRKIENVLSIYHQILEDYAK